MRIIGLLRVVALIVVAACLPGCGSLPTQVAVTTGGEPLRPGDPGYGTTLQIRYLGAGGVLMTRGADSLLTAPFFSNPSLLNVALWSVKTDRAEVDRFLAPMAADLATVKAVLLGHAHYDHLMDLPYIKARYLPNAHIYGSDTAKYILAAYPDVDQNAVVSVQSAAGTVAAPGKWWPVGSRLRFMALRSKHAPIVFQYKFSEGTYEAPLDRIPTSAFDWREGETLAFVIEFLAEDGRSVDFRVHYQDAASTPPLGFAPTVELSNPAQATIAILCLPGFDRVDSYPESLVRHLRPDLVVGIHWESFFERIPDDPARLHTVPLLDGDRFVVRLGTVLPQGARFVLPAPGAWMNVPDPRLR
jgi:hypothetical protein